jgi:hypothetical protein
LTIFLEEVGMTVSGLRGTYVAAAAGALAIIAVLAVWAPWSAESRGIDLLQADDLTVSCGAGQQAVVRRIASTGGSQVGIACVDAVRAPARAAYTPAAYTQSAPAQSARPVAYRDPAPVRSEARSRPWQKTALVIGGSAGAGAGIGAIAGGKKGALIGAAIGGGSAAIFEAIKR